MKRIGITGGIGAGKSLVCKIFELLGVPNYPADARAKWLQENNNEVRNQILELLGEKAYLETGSLNRPYISKIVFEYPDKLKGLNQIVHPAVAHDFEEWCKQHKDKPFILKEAALLFETGSYQQLDATILVYAPEELRLSRTKSRDPHRKTEDIRKIMNQQISQEKSKQLADHIIYNDGQKSLIQQCNQLYKNLSR